MDTRRRSDLLTAGIFGVVLIAIVVLGFPSHVDESVYLRAIRVFASEPLSVALDSYVAPVGPLQYLPLAVVASFFGTDLGVLRLASVLIFALPFAVLTAISLRRAATSDSAALVTAGVLASPYIFATGFTIYSEPAALALGQASLYWWLRSTLAPDGRSSSRSLAVALGFAGLAVLVRQFQLLLFVALVVPLALTRRLQARDLLAAALALLPALALFARWGNVVPPGAAPATESIGLHGKLFLQNVAVLGAYGWPTLFVLRSSRPRTIAAILLGLAAGLALDASLPWGLHAHGLAVASSALDRLTSGAGAILAAVVASALHVVGWAVVLAALSRLRGRDPFELLFATAIFAWLAVNPLAGRTYERYIVTLLPIAAMLWVHRGLPGRVRVVWLAQMVVLAVALALRWTGRL